MIEFIQTVRPKDDEEFLKIKNCDFGKFYDFMRGKDTAKLRLPLNNQKAYEYLRWLNNWFCESIPSNFLNYSLNSFDGMVYDPNHVPVRPRTINEIILESARWIVDADKNHKNENELDTTLFVYGELISDAYYFSSVPNLITSGIAGAYLNFGTWEDNPIDFEFKISE